MASYENINYSLRPAKTIERKMLRDAFRKLTAFAKLDSYRYIGFGSTYFSDFSLFHKDLGIKNMLSIEYEENETKQRRFEFNRPFNCVQIRFDHSNDVLSTISWEPRTIVWLDYDGSLDQTVLADIQFICSSATAGSVIVISINAHPDRIDVNRRDKLERSVGEENIPLSLKSKNDNDFDDALAGWGTARVYRDIIHNKIKDVLRERNFGLASENKMKYLQIFNFQYADGAKMLTVGGVLYDEGLSPQIASCQFERLEFVKTHGEAYRISVLSLTYREIRFLDKFLPISDETELEDLLRDKEIYIPPRDVKHYGNLYRYFPNFAETDV
jgi:hypothetical protein